MLPSKKRILVAIAAIVVVLSASYGWVAHRYWSNPPRLSRNFTAEWNAPILRTPIEQRAWPIYQKLLLEWAEGRVEPVILDFEEVLRDNEKAGWIRSRAASIVEARRAAHLPRLGGLLYDAPSSDDVRVQSRYSSEQERAQKLQEPLRKPSDNPKLLSVLLPFVADGREIGRVLLAEAALAARDGDGTRATEDIVAAVAFAGQLRETPMLVCDLVGLSQFTQALRAWGRLMELYPNAWNEAQLLEIDAAVRAFADGDLQPRLSGERDQFYDIVQRMYSDDGSGNGLFYPTEAIFDADNPKPLSLFDRATAPLAAYRFPSRRKTLDQFDALLRQGEAAMVRPYWEKPSFEAYDRQINSERSQSNPLIALLAPSLWSLHVSFQGAAQNRDAVLAAGALLRYRLRHRQWPETLESLIPDFLPALPPDRFTGKSLRYLPREPQPVLYSVGDDLQDDGGRPAMITGHYRPRPGDELIHSEEPWYWNIHRGGSEKGDLILWPVAPRSPTHVEP